MLTPVINCRNCSNTISDNFCGHCGQPVKLKRVDAHYIAHEIQHVLHLEKGILFTIKGLMSKPGQNVKDFITDNRSRLVKPVLFIIITSLIYTSVNHLFHIEDGYFRYINQNESTATHIFSWIQNHYGYSNIIMGLFIAFWLKLLFKKYNYNLFEILILLCFVVGMTMLIFSVFAIAEGLSKQKLMPVGGVVGLVYCSWAIGQFYGNKFGNYLKALAAYLLGTITFSLTVLILGFIIDCLIRG